jgi:hypothetical protein
MDKVNAALCIIKSIQCLLFVQQFLSKCDLHTSISSLLPVQPKIFQQLQIYFTHTAVTVVMMTLTVIFTILSENQ